MKRPLADATNLQPYKLPKLETSTSRFPNLKDLPSKLNTFTQAHLPRVCTTVIDYSLSCAQTLLPSIIERQCINQDTSDKHNLIPNSNLNNDILNTVFQFINLKTLLLLRSVSKNFHNFISMPNTLLSILESRVTLSFRYFLPLDRRYPYLPKEHFSTKVPKSVFALANTTLKLHTSITALLDPSLEIHSVPNHKLIISLEIQTLRELHQLHSHISKPFTKNLLSNIQTLCFNPLEINTQTGPYLKALLTTISQNLKSLPNLSTLVLGNIAQGYTFELSDIFQNLQCLSIGKIQANASLKFSNSFNQLLHLSIENIDNLAILEASASFNTLQSFTIGNQTHFYTTENRFNDVSSVSNQYHKAFTKLFTSPTHLTTLTALHIGAIHSNSTLTLPKFENLENISVLNIQTFSSLELPNSLNKIRNLFIPKIWAYGDFILPKFMPELTNFCVGTTWESLFPKLPPILPKLTNLEIDSTSNNITELDTIAPNLVNLTIKTIHKPGLTILKIPGLSSLTIQNIGRISDKPQSSIELQADNLITLSIGDLNSGSTLKLPPLMNKLENLTINKIHINAHLSLPTECNSLKKIIVNSSLESQSTYLELQSFCSQRNIHFIHNRISH